VTKRIGDIGLPGTHLAFIHLKARGQATSQPVESAARALRTGVQEAAGELDFEIAFLDEGPDWIWWAVPAAGAVDLLLGYVRASRNREAPGADAGMTVARRELPADWLSSACRTLATSAGRLRHSPGDASVDWSLSLDGSAADPVALRRRDAVLRYTEVGQTRTLVLSAKPYTVHGRHEEEGLEALQRSARQVAERWETARAPLQQLTQSVAEGYRSGLAAHKRLPAWMRSLPALTHCWRTHGSGVAVTQARDLLELASLLGVSGDTP
jgi:hypothetical protein